MVASDEPDDEFELERAHDRTELAAVFREFATAFESGRPVRLNGEGRSVRVAVPERVVAAFEAGLGVDEPQVGELEIELEWDDPTGSSVRITDRPADGGAASGDRDETSAAADVDPAAAVMPLEGLAGDGSTGDSGTDETPVTAEGDDTAETDETSETGRTSRFEVYEDRGGEWRWRLVHWNGNIVADSGEGYASRSNAERAARSVMRIAPNATIERLE
ncbi:amphi-Trp domain-containing protein [Natrinema thermotolerans]